MVESDDSSRHTRESSLDSLFETSLPELPGLLLNYQQEGLTDSTHIDPPTPGDVLSDFDLDAAVDEEDILHKFSLVDEGTNSSSSFASVSKQSEKDPQGVHLRSCETRGHPEAQNHGVLPIIDQLMELARNDPELTKTHTPSSPRDGRSAPSISRPGFTMLVDYSSDEDEGMEEQDTAFILPESISGKQTGEGERIHAPEQPIPPTQTVSTTNLQSSPSPPPSERAATNTRQENLRALTGQRCDRQLPNESGFNCSASGSDSISHSRGSSVNETLQMERKRPRAPSPPSNLSPTTKRMRPAGPFLDDQSDGEVKRHAAPARKLNLNRLKEIIAKRPQNSATALHAQSAIDAVQPDKPRPNLQEEDAASRNARTQSHRSARESLEHTDPRREQAKAPTPSERTLGAEKRVAVDNSIAGKESKQPSEKATLSGVQQLQNPAKKLKLDTTFLNNGRAANAQNRALPELVQSKNNAELQTKKDLRRPTQQAGNVGHNSTSRETSKPGPARGPVLQRPAPEKPKAPIAQPQPKVAEPVVNSNQQEPSVRKISGRISGVKASKATSGVFPAITPGTLRADNAGTQASGKSEQEEGGVEDQVHIEKKSTGERAATGKQRSAGAKISSKEKEPVANETKRRPTAPQPVQSFPTPPASQTLSQVPEQALASPRPIRPDTRRVEVIEASIKQSQQPPETAKPSVAPKKPSSSVIEDARSTANVVKGTWGTTISNGPSIKDRTKTTVEPPKAQQGVPASGASNIKAGVENTEQTPRSQAGVNPSTISSNKDAVKKAVEPPKTPQRVPASDGSNIKAGQQKAVEPPKLQQAAKRSTASGGGDGPKKILEPPKTTPTKTPTATPSKETKIAEAKTGEQNATATASPKVSQPPVEKPAGTLPTPPTSDRVQAPQKIFEYTIREKLYSEVDASSSTPDTQIVSRAYTDLDEANAQAEQRINATLQHPTFYTIQVEDWQKKRDDNDCITFLSTFTSLQDRVKRHYHKIWVERRAVPKNPAHIITPRIPFINKTLYILRLCKVIQPDDEDTSTSIPTPPILEYQNLSTPTMRQNGLFSEITTVLDDANRAARRLQITLSHKKDPSSEAEKKWQEEDNRKLRDKVHALDSTLGGSEGYWKSEFNGLGGERYRLVVEPVGVSGPRNI